MNRLVEFISSDGHTKFYIESAENTAENKGGGLEKAGVISIKFDDALEKLKPFSQGIMDYIHNHKLKPDSTTLEFGFSIEAGGNIFVAKATGEATVRVTMHWNHVKE